MSVFLYIFLLPRYTIFCVISWQQEKLREFWLEQKILMTFVSISSHQTLGQKCVYRLLLELKVQGQVLAQDSCIARLTEKILKFQSEQKFLI